MSRAYGWRASCPAGGVTAVGVGSGAWFGSISEKETQNARALAMPELCCPHLVNVLRFCGDVRIG